MSNKISAELLKGAFIIGAKRLEEKKETINDLNVFPVPDGDTGTNMSMTVKSAMTEIENSNFDDIPSLCKAVSQGSLRGARGNSGVILSQLFRGFYKVLKTSDDPDLGTLSEAFSKATETAYRAVMMPKEGTILTIAKAISDKASVVCNEDITLGEFYDELVAAATDMLDKTPDMLPVLKQAGVVDSGGAGLIEILKGAADYINGRDTDIKSAKKKPVQKPEFLYNVSFDLYSKNELSEKDIKEISKSITKVLKPNITETIKIKNNNKTIEKPKEEESEAKDFGFVTVCVGKGLAQIFESLGVDYCIKGGQTMNPSTEDLCDAIANVNAKTVFLMPNNKNIILAAEQAAKLTNDKNVVIIPTKSIPQGIAAIISFMPDANSDENKEAMLEGISYIKSCEITNAVRDTVIDDKEIKEGDYMGIGDDGIVAVNKNLNKCIDEMLGEVIDEDSSLLSIYYGKDIKESDAKKLSTRLTKKYPDIEIEVQSGGQPVYYYLMSVE